MKSLMIAACLAAVSLPAFAADPANGEKLFNQCKSCHSIIKPDGTAVVKGGKIGPDLWGVVGRAAGSEADYKYGDSLKEAGASGAVWDEAALAAWVADPTAWLNGKLGKTDAKTKMTFKLKSGGEDVAAWLATQK